MQHLVEGGANIDARNARGQSALHLAALAQSPETVEFLLKSGEYHDVVYGLWAKNMRISLSLRI